MSEDALEAVNKMLGIDGVVTHKGDEIKCWTHDGEGGRSKAYLTKWDCAALASAFEALSYRLSSGGKGEDNAK